MNIGALVARGGGRFRQDRVVRVDIASRRVQLEASPPLSYDALSITLGSCPPPIPAASEAVGCYSVKPIRRLCELRAEREMRFDRRPGRRVRVAVAGGGVTACEVAANIAALAEARGGRTDVTVLAGSRLLKQLPDRAAPRARLADGDAGEREWRSELLPAYQRLSRRAELLIAQVYLAGVNTRRVRRALQTLFAGRIGKDAVSRAWRKTRTAWEAWQQRDLTREDMVRLILDGTVVKVRLDRRATAISLLIVLGIRRDGQKVVLAIKNLGGESEAAWRAVLDDLLARGLAKPELVIVDGGKGLEAALASLWEDIPVQRCTVHKERNLLAHAPKHLHDEGKADFNDLMHAKTAEEVLAKRKAFLTRWKLRCRPVATSLEEAGERLFTFLRYSPDQWRSLRTTDAIERLHEEFKRRIKTQCLLPCAETTVMLFWALLASGQITMRRVDGWQTLDRSPSDLDLAA